MQDQQTASPTVPASGPQGADRIELDTLQNEYTHSAQDVIGHGSEQVGPLGPATSPLAAISQSSTSLPSNVSVVAPTASVSEPRTPAVSSPTVAQDDDQDQLDLNSLASDEGVESAAFGVPSISEPATSEPDLRSHDSGNGVEDPQRQQADQPQRPPQFTTYYEYVSSLTEYFPGLREVYRNGRRPYLDVSVVDISVDGTCHIQDFVAVSETESVQPSPVYDEFRQVARQIVPEGIDIRFILVQDLSNLTVQLIGKLFDLDPEFFAEHLQLSDHQQRGLYRFGSRNVPKENDVGEERLLYIDPLRKDLTQSSNWLPEAMHKSYRSFSWYRLVEIQPLRPNPHNSDGLSPDLQSNQGYSGICRLGHWEFEADDSVDMVRERTRRRREPLAFWRERMSICELEIAGRMIGMCIPLFPLSCLP